MNYQIDIKNKTIKLTGDPSLEDLKNIIVFLETNEDYRVVLENSNVTYVPYIPYTYPQYPQWPNIIY